MKVPMTLAQHIETAEDLSKAQFHLSRVYDRCQAHNSSTSRLMKYLLKIHPLTYGGIFSSIKDELDTRYHKVVSDAQFNDLGHIYYSKQGD